MCNGSGRGFHDGYPQRPQRLAPSSSPWVLPTESPSCGSAPRLARNLFVALMVSFTMPDHDPAWRSSVGRVGAAPRLARFLFLVLMMSFADAQQCANTAIGAPGYASDCDCAIEFASNEFATEDDYDFITVNGVSSHGYSLTNLQVAAETAQLVDTFSTTTFGAAQACTHGSLETLKARVAAKSLSNMTSTGAKVDPTLDDFQTTLMVSIISYLGGLLETDTFKAKNTIDVEEEAHETDPDSIPQARSSTTAPAPLPLIWECSVCSARYCTVPSRPLRSTLAPRPSPQSRGRRCPKGAVSSALPLPRADPLLGAARRAALGPRLGSSACSS